MKEIISLDELNSLIFPYLKRGVITNNFLKMTDYNLYFRERALFYENTENILLIIRRVDDINHIYFYINGEDDITFPSNSVIEIAEPEEKIIEFMKKSGLNEVKVRKEMKLEEFRKLDEKAEVYLAKDEEAGDIRHIIEDNFDEIYGVVPSIEELKADNVLVSKDENGKINGLVHFKTTKLFSQIFHIVATQKGIGKKLLSGYINYERDKCNEFRLWVNSDNTEAIEFYLKNGYEFSGRESVVFSNIRTKE